MAEIELHRPPNQASARNGASLCGDQARQLVCEKRAASRCTATLPKTWQRSWQRPCGPDGMQAPPGREGRDNSRSCRVLKTLREPCSKMGARLWSESPPQHTQHSRRCPRPSALPPDRCHPSNAPPPRARCACHVAPMVRGRGHGLVGSDVRQCLDRLAHGGTRPPKPRSKSRQRSPAASPKRSSDSHGTARPVEPRKSSHCFWSQPLRQHTYTKMLKDPNMQWN